MTQPFHVDVTTDPDTVRLARSFAFGRIGIGAASIAAPRLFSRVLGFPKDHDNPTSRLIGRLFGVRDIALGVLVLRAVDDPQRLSEVALHNAFVDAGDAASIIGSLVAKQGITRGAISSLAAAIGGGSCWLILRSRLSRPPG